MSLYFVIFLLHFFGALSTSKSELQNDQPSVEIECAPYCLNLFLQNTENMNNKLEACEIKNKQMAVLQSQLAVLKFKENMCEKTIREKDEKCKSQEQLDADNILVDGGLINVLGQL
ncbi:hypothetical protein ACLKA6_013636 [Drosophila palustris]